MVGSRDDDPPDRIARRGSVTGSAAGQRAGEAGMAGQGGRAVEVLERRAGGPPVDAEALRGLACAVLDDLAVPVDMAVDVTCVDTVEMAQLNAAHLDGEGPTDVLAFPLDEPGQGRPGVPEILGDVVLCPEVAAAQAAEAGRSAHAELEMLLVHGLLHLLGYDHAEPEERRQMFGLTDALLSRFGKGGS